MDLLQVIFEDSAEGESYNIPAGYTTTRNYCFQGRKKVFRSAKCLMFVMLVAVLHLFNLVAIL